MRHPNGIPLRYPQIVSIEYPQDLTLDAIALSDDVVVVNAIGTFLELRDVLRIGGESREVVAIQAHTEPVPGAAPSADGGIPVDLHVHVTHRATDRPFELMPRAPE